MRLFGANRIAGLVDRLGLPEDQPINARLLSNSIENAQKRIEDQNFKRRKYVLTYDDVMNQQRNLIYKQRLEVLNGEDMTETIRTMIRTSVEETVDSYLGGDDPELWNIDGLTEHYKSYLLKPGDLSAEELKKEKAKPSDVAEKIIAIADGIFEEKKKLFGADFAEVERSILLRSVDSHWMEHIDTMEDLKGSINLQAYAQRDPVNEYRLQGSELFEEMVAGIREETVRTVLSVFPRKQPIVRVQVAKPLQEGFEGQGDRNKKATVILRKAEKVGRNDLCPCGSGKKYKKCCGAPQNQNHNG